MDYFQSQQTLRWVFLGQSLPRWRNSETGINMFLIGFENRCTKLLMIDCPSICPVACLSLFPSVCLPVCLSVLVLGICTCEKRAVFPHCVGRTSHIELSHCTHLHKCTPTHTGVLTETAAVGRVHPAASLCHLLPNLFFLLSSILLSIDPALHLHLLFFLLSSTASEVYIPSEGVHADIANA